jgi:hypothetical protein
MYRFLAKFEFRHRKKGIRESVLHEHYSRFSGGKFGAKNTAWQGFYGKIFPFDLAAKSERFWRLSFI